MNLPSFLKQETGPACVGILHCCEYRTLSFCFISIYFTRTDGECVFDLRWLENWYYWGRHSERDRQRLRQRETWNPVTARSLWNWQLLLLVCMLLDVDIFHLRFCTLPLDVGLAFLKESSISLRNDVNCIREAQNWDQKGAGESRAS